MVQANNMENNSVFNELKPREKRYVLEVVSGKNDTDTESARQAGCPGNSASQRAREMNAKPEIQESIAALELKIGDVDNIDIKALVNRTLIDQAINAKQDRDKQSAAVSLGKTQKMFVDVQDTTTRASKDDDKDLLTRIEREFGKDARDKAAMDIGYDE